MRHFHCLLIGAALTAFATSRLAAGRYDPGANDTTIKLGNTMPYSGPASAYSTIGRAEAAYFRFDRTSWVLFGDVLGE